jgi:microcystin-dependent protein
MSEPFLAEIRMFGGNFAPRGWALCNGQILPIAQNTALFSLLGTTFGGNGQTTFALPDLRGRVPVHPGQGPGLSNYDLGEVTGTESVTILTNQMPAHTHLAAANSGNGDLPAATNNVWATPVDSTGAAGTGYAATANTTMSQAAIGSAGGGQPLPIIQPLLCVNFIIALEGIYPSRN